MFMMDGASEAVSARLSRLTPVPVSTLSTLKQITSSNSIQCSAVAFLN